MDTPPLFCCFVLTHILNNPRLFLARLIRLILYVRPLKGFFPSPRPFPSLLRCKSQLPFPNPYQCSSCCRPFGLSIAVYFPNIQFVRFSSSPLFHLPGPPPPQSFTELAGLQRVRTNQSHLLPSFPAFRTVRLTTRRVTHCRFFFFADI